MYIRIIGILVFTALGIYAGTAHPFAPELSATGHWCMASLVIAVGLWVFAPRRIPFSAGGLLMLMICLAAGVSYSAVFSGFTSAAIWILIPALYFGYALSKTGLGRRVAYRIISVFQPSYLTLTLSWLVIGLILSAFTPSIAVRIAIVIPIAATTVEICNVTGRSKGSAFIMLVAWAMLVIPGTGWLTGALWGPIGKGFFDANPGLAGLITFSSWSKAILLPAELITILFIGGMYLVMRPEEPIKVPSAVFKKAYKELGPMSFREKATLVILSLTFIMFATGSLHHIQDAAICLGSFLLLTFVGVIELKDIGRGISWDLILYLGSVLGMGAVFAESGVAAFLVNTYTPVLDNLSIPPWAFIYLFVIVLFVWRFLDVAQLNPTLPIILPAFVIIMDNFGIDPLVSFSVCIMAGNSFFMAYQQPFAMLAESLGASEKWSPKQLAQAGTVYFLACMAAIAISLPYWKWTGLIG